MDYSLHMRQVCDSPACLQTVFLLKNNTHGFGKMFKLIFYTIMWLILYQRCSVITEIVFFSTEQIQDLLGPEAIYVFQAKHVRIHF
jgi:hypothetical protein